MITTVLVVFDLQDFEFVEWNKGLNTQVTPLPEKQKIAEATILDRSFWEKFIHDRQVTHLLLLTRVNYAVQGKKLQATLSGLCACSLIPRPLAVAYGCNQGQLLVILPEGKDSYQVGPVIDYQVQAGYTQVASREDLARTVWECALQTGMDHPGRTALLLENIICVGGDVQEPLKQSLEQRLPVTAFAGDAQPKKISFRTTPDYHGPIPTDMVAFFGALIAARAIFSTDSLYQK